MTAIKTPIVETFASPPRSGQRRRFTTEQKLSLLEEATAPGSSISAVARRGMAVTYMPYPTPELELARPVSMRARNS